MNISNAADYQWQEFLITGATVDTGTMGPISGHISVASEPENAVVYFHRFDDGQYDMTWTGKYDRHLFIPPVDCSLPNFQAVMDTTREWVQTLADMERAE